MDSVFSRWVNSLTECLVRFGFESERAEFVSEIIILLIAVAIFLGFAWVVYRCLKFVLPRFLEKISKKTKNIWDDSLCVARFPQRLTHMIVAILCIRLNPHFFANIPNMEKFVGLVANLYFAIALTGTIFAIVNASHEVSAASRGKGAPIKGFFQALKLGFGLFAAVWVLSILSDKSPMYFLSGVGALMAILIIVFRDALLGFTAGIMISVNKTVEVGDWLELDDKTDGVVEDISLTTVKIRNWDNTISAIPAYSLISERFKNWRGMTDLGGRRIKRAINIDLETVHFATEEELQHWNKIKILQPYLARKLKEIRDENTTEVGPRINENDEKISSFRAFGETMANSRHLTNLGTFRAYCVEYLKQKPEIHKGMTLIVRQQNFGATGIPLEIYAFSKDTNWENYENIQSDIFDHLLAILHEFNLRAFQSPTGKNFDGLIEKTEKEAASPGDLSAK